MGNAQQATLIIVNRGICKEKLNENHTSTHNQYFGNPTLNSNLYPILFPTVLSQSPLLSPMTTQTTFLKGCVS